MTISFFKALGMEADSGNGRLRRAECPQSERWLPRYTELNQLLVWVKVLFQTCTKGIRLLIKPVWRFLSARVFSFFCLFVCLFFNKRNRIAKPVCLKLLCVYESSRAPVKMQTLIQEVWGGDTQDSAFLTSSWVLLMVLVQGPHFE